jgi:aminoglycoside 3-N-acetyltransferase
MTTPSPTPSASPHTQADIEAGLRALGVAPGMRLITHSSLRAVGYVEGGAATIVRALMHVVGPRGTLLFPTFNHGETFGPDLSVPFDARSTRTTNGAIPEAFRGMADVHRSLDPTHPFAAWGADAEWFVAEHHRTLTMGKHSPLGRLLAAGGHALLLGVDYDRNTFHHVVETMTDAPCLGRRCEAYPLRTPDGRVVVARTWGWRAGVCPITDEMRYGRLMRERGLDRRGTIGAAPSILFALRDCFDVVAEALRDGLDGFPPCSRCPVRPRVAPNTVPSDWDDAAGRPRPNSVCWTY